MKQSVTICSVPRHAARPAVLPPQEYSLTALRRLIATWRWRLRFRWELAQKARANPHLIDDIGLTRRQVEEEIAKPFWQS